MINGFGKCRKKSSVLGLQHEPENLDVLKFVLKSNRIPLTHMNNQEKVKTLLNGMNVVNVE